VTDLLSAENVFTLLMAIAFVRAFMMATIRYSERRIEHETTGEIDPVNQALLDEEVYSWAGQCVLVGLLLFVGVVQIFFVPELEAHRAQDPARMLVVGAFLLFAFGTVIQQEIAHYYRSKRKKLMLGDETGNGT